MLIPVIRTSDTSSDPTRIAFDKRYDEFVKEATSGKDVWLLAGAALLDLWKIVDGDICVRDSDAAYVMRIDGCHYKFRESLLILNLRLINFVGRLMREDKQRVQIWDSLSKTFNEIVAMKSQVNANWNVDASIKIMSDNYYAAEKCMHELYFQPGATRFCQ